MLAFAALRRRGEFGVLGPVVVRESRRRQGLATRVLQTILAWFDMSDGRWLLTRTPPAFAEPVFGKFGFQLLRSAGVDSTRAQTLLRRPPQLPADPNSGRAGRIRTANATVADWPELVLFLQFHAAPDTRGSLIETALNAEELALEWLHEQSAGKLALLLGKRGDRIAAIGGVRLDATGGVTQAFLSPADKGSGPLRPALIAAANPDARVEFPFEPEPAPATEASPSMTESEPAAPASDRPASTEDGADSRGTTPDEQP